MLYILNIHTYSTLNFPYKAVTYVLLLPVFYSLEDTGIERNSN